MRILAVLTFLVILLPWQLQAADSDSPAPPHDLGRWRHPANVPSSGANADKPQRDADAGRAADATRDGVTARPGAVSEGFGIASMAGDDDNFGYGVDHFFGTTCENFDHRGPEDLGVFDQNQPGAAFNRVCSFV